MALMPQYSEGSYIGNVDVPDSQGPMTYDKFMALSPQQRHDYLMQGDVTQYGYSPEYGYAANLRNIVPDATHSNATLSVDQYRAILGNSGLDPSTAQAIGSNLGGILDDQNRARQDTTKDKIARAGAIATAVWAGGAGIAGALGAGAAGAGAGTGEGLAAGGATTSGGLGAGTELGSFLGPTTGTVEAAPVIGGAGTPIVSGIAEGSSPFISGAGGLGSMMPGAVPESSYDLSNNGLFQTGPGQFEQLPMNAGGSGAFLGTGGFGAGAEGATGSASGGGTAAAGGGSALSRILSGEGTLQDYLSVGGAAAPGLIGAYAANRQANSLEALSRDYMALGAPSRARYESSFAPGFSMANEPGYKDALDQTTKSFLHKASIGGNPSDSPNAWMQTLHDVNSNFAFPALQNYRNQNAATGGFNAFNTAAPNAAAGAINANANVANALGGAAADVFNPPTRLKLSDLLSAGR